MNREHAEQVQLVAIAGLHVVAVLHTSQVLLRQVQDHRAAVTAAAVAAAGLHAVAAVLHTGQVLLRQVPDHRTAVTAAAATAVEVAIVAVEVTVVVAAVAVGEDNLLLI